MPEISGLNTAVSVNDADVVAIVQGGETKKLSADKLSGLKAIGEGQTWQDVTLGRSIGVVYTNTTGKAIQISVNTSFSTSANDLALEVDGLYVSRSQGNEAVYNRESIECVIPEGSSYAVRVFAGTTASLQWFELR